MGRLWVWGSSIVLAAALFVACGGGSDDRAGDRAEETSPTTPTTTAPAEDVDMTGAAFPNINTLTPVGNHFVGNLSGHLDEALAVANAADGGTYPVGTIIQLVPQEAMVKRAAGWSPATNDWEFFSLEVSAEGTTILTRGQTDVVNRFGTNCMACHSKADPKWDFVCDKTHGCDPLPLTDELITAIQGADPRPMS